MTFADTVMGASTASHALCFPIKRKDGNGKTVQQLDDAATRSSFPRKPGLMDCWWVWMLWQMSGGQREPAERSIVLRWPVKNSIIPPSHLWVAPFLPLRQATSHSEKYHRYKLAQSPDSITGLYRNTSHSHLWLSAKVLRRRFGSQFGGISVNTSVHSSVWSQSCHRVNKRNSSQSGRSFDSVSTAITCLIYMISYRQICATDFWWNKTGSDNKVDRIPYITPSVRHRYKRSYSRRLSLGGSVHLFKWMFSMWVSRSTITLNTVLLWFYSSGTIALWSISVAFQIAKNQTKASWHSLGLKLFAWLTSVLI